MGVFTRNEDGKGVIISYCIMESCPINGIHAILTPMDYISPTLFTPLDSNACKMIGKEKDITTWRCEFCNSIAKSPYEPALQPLNTEAREMGEKAKPAQAKPKVIFPTNEMLSGYLVQSIEENISVVRRITGPDFQVMFGDAVLLGGKYQNPYKDELVTLRPEIKKRDGDDAVIYDYAKTVDLGGRGRVPLRLVESHKRLHAEASRLKQRLIDETVLGVERCARRDAENERLKGDRKTAIETGMELAKLHNELEAENDQLKARVLSLTAAIKECDHDVFVPLSTSDEHDKRLADCVREWFNKGCYFANPHGIGAMSITELLSRDLSNILGLPSNVKSTIPKPAATSGYMQPIDDEGNPIYIKQKMTLTGTESYTHTDDSKPIGFGVWGDSPAARESVKCEVPDGYCNEHRHMLFINLMIDNPKISWRANNADDGGYFEGWFIAGMNLPTGAISYHLPSELWELLDHHMIATSNCAPSSQTPQTVCDRLNAWIKDKRTSPAKQPSGTHGRTDLLQDMVVDLKAKVSAVVSRGAPTNNVGDGDVCNYCREYMDCHVAAVKEEHKPDCSWQALENIVIRGEDEEEK